jgi:hypothetical protein
MRKALIVVCLACVAVGCATTEYGERAKYAGVRCEDGKRALYAFQKCRPPTSTPEDSEFDEYEEGGSVEPSS